MQAIKRMVGTDRYAVLLPLNEFEPLQVLALQQPEAMLRDGDRYGNFRSASFRRALAFYHDTVPAVAGARRMTETQISNVWNEFGRGYFSFYVSGPWNIAEFKTPAAARAARQLDDCADARPRWARRVQRRRLEPGDLRALAPQGQRLRS